MVQELVSNGHSWSNVKQYTLSEIGVFLRSIRTRKERDRVEMLSYNWMSSNLNHEGIEKVIDSMKKESPSFVKKERTKEEVANEWRRLASRKMG